MILDRIGYLEHVIFTQFGPATGEIAHILLNRGPLQISQLLRLSGLSPQTVFSALLILSLHSLLYHSESEVAGRLIELYEINVQEIDNRRRGSLYMELVSGVEGRLDVALRVLWRDGMSPSALIIDQVANTIFTESQSSIEDARKLARRMLSRAIRDGYISIVTPGSQLSPTALSMKWEEDLKLRIKGVPTNKDLKEMSDTLREKKEQWAEEEYERARGRAPSGDTSSRKRKLEQGKDDNLVPLTKGAFYKINPEKFQIQWRNQLILEYARNIYNDAVYAVLKLILDTVEPDIDHLSEPSSRTFSTTELIAKFNALSPQPPLVHCFVPQTPDPSWKPPTKSTESIIEICKILEREDDMNPDPDRHFLVRIGAREGGVYKYAVNFGPLIIGMQKAIIESIIEQKLDASCLKCWRIIHGKGKLDEKQIARVSFLSVKETRESLAKLHGAGLIDQQEVPRSADRAPSRTFFLWYVNFAKVVTSLLDHQYKAMANLETQRQHQFTLRKALIEKTERTDVKENPELLSARDRIEIEEMEKKMEALTVASMRIDQDVFIMQL